MLVLAGRKAEGILDLKSGADAPQLSLASGVSSVLPSLYLVVDAVQLAIGIVNALYVGAQKKPGITILATSSRNTIQVTFFCSRSSQ